MADEIIELAANIPFEMTVKYCDLFPSKKPDEYPARVRFKASNGDQLYLDADKAFGCLIACGAISDHPQFEDQSQLRKAGTKINLSNNKLTFLLSQKPKEKARTLSINGATAGAASAPSASTGSAAAPSTVTAPPNREKRLRIYLHATSFVLEKVKPLYDAKDLKLSATDVKEITNTIFICETRN